MHLILTNKFEFPAALCITSTPQPRQVNWSYQLHNHPSFHKALFRSPVEIGALNLRDLDLPHPGGTGPVESELHRGLVRGAVAKIHVD